MGHVKAELIKVGFVLVEQCNNLKIIHMECLRTILKPVEQMSHFLFWKTGIKHVVFDEADRKFTGLV